MSDERSFLKSGDVWVCVDSADPWSLATWWQQLLGGEVNVDEDGDVSLRSDGVRLLFLAVADAKVVKNRLHLDVRSTNFDAAVDAAVGLGAQRADDVYRGSRWQVLRDPEGNEFCILRPDAAND